MAAGVALLPAVLSAVGTGIGVIGQLQQASAAERAEKARERQAKLEAMRRQRETIRQAAVARAQAISSATNQGAGETSALAGGLAQITTQATRTNVATGQDLTLARQVFSANEDAARAGGLIAIGNGISSLGGAFSNAFPAFQRMTA